MCCSGDWPTPGDEEQGDTYDAEGESDDHNHHVDDQYHQFDQEHDLG